MAVIGAVLAIVMTAVLVRAAGMREGADAEGQGCKRQDRFLHGSLLTRIGCG